MGAFLWLGRFDFRFLVLECLLKKLPDYKLVVLFPTPRMLSFRPYGYAVLSSLIQNSSLSRRFE